MFIRERRKEHKLSLRKFANLVGISPAYLSSIESGCRTAPTEKVLAKMSEVLMLSDRDKTFMSDLAASSKKKGMVATDIADYISKNKYVSNAIRTAINLHIDKDDWENFIGLMEKKYLK
ncbi:helix-turn-helix domain-containing protein [Ruminococcus sp. LCP21S3_E8]